jgi:hypothetical protein
VVTQNSNYPQPIYSVNEHHYNQPPEELAHYRPPEESHHYQPYSTSMPPPALISPHLEELPPPINVYHSSNVLVPLHEEPMPSPRTPVSTAPARDSSVKRASKKENRSSSKNGKSDAGISIPLSKIISKSSIPSLAQNSPYGSSRSHIPNHVSNQSPAPRGSHIENYTSFEAPVYNCVPSSNLISVTPKLTPKPNLYEIPITETITITAKPSPEKSDLNAVPTSTTSTPNSISPLKSNDTCSSSPASTSTLLTAFSGNYTFSNENNLFHHNLNNKYMHVNSEPKTLAYDTISVVSNNVFGYTNHEITAGDGDNTPPPPGTSPC